ncbi:MAG: STAS/SEC14 domain-containing protein [Bacteroidia bacterium]
MDNRLKQNVMQIPENVKTYEMTSSILWFDKEGILYSSPKPGIPPEMNMEEILKEMEKFREIIGHKKVCMVTESSPNSRPPSKSERDFIAEQINSVTKAMAIITNSPVSRMVANLFFGLKPPPYPVKMFSNEKDAVEWIRQFNK